MTYQIEELYGDMQRSKTVGIAKGGKQLVIEIRQVGMPEILARIENTVSQIQDPQKSG